MDELEDARQHWVDDRPAFEKFVDRLIALSTDLIRQLGIWASVEGRTKEVHSLVKKLISKPTARYHDMADKAGVRVIVRYRPEVEQVVAKFKDLLVVRKVECKADSLPADTFGYLSTHLDVSLCDNDPFVQEFPPSRFIAEIQVRTLAQHLWSEMSHDAFYKASHEIPNDLRRSLFVLAGVVELADQEFSRIASGVPISAEVQVLRALEQQYFRLCVRRGDHALSLDVIRMLLPLYENDASAVPLCVAHLVEAHQHELQHIYSSASGDAASSAYLFQPEALLIYDLLERKPWELQRAWGEHFPRRELERLANTFGIALSG